MWILSYDIEGGREYIWKKQWRIENRVILWKMCEERKWLFLSKLCGFTATYSQSLETVAILNCHTANTVTVFIWECFFLFVCEFLHVFFSRSLKSFFFNGPRPTCVKFKNKTQSYLSYTQKIAMDSVDICRHFWSYDIVYIVDIVCMACFENKIQIWFALFSFLKVKKKYVS